MITRYWPEVCGYGGHLSNYIENGVTHHNKFKQWTNVKYWRNVGTETQSYWYILNGYLYILINNLFLCIGLHIFEYMMYIAI